MAGIQSAASSVAGGIKEKMAGEKADKMYGDSRMDRQSDEAFRNKQLDQQWNISAANRDATAALYKNNPLYLQAQANIKAGAAGVDLPFSNLNQSVVPSSGVDFLNSNQPFKFTLPR
jgi:hypothetical protein